MFNVLRDRFFLVMALLILGCCEDVLANDPVLSRRPFNYKAYEARQKGFPIVMYKPADSVVSLEDLKVTPAWPGFLRFPNRTDGGVIHAYAGCDWANWAFNSKADLADPSVLVVGDAPVTVADTSLIVKLHGESLDDYLDFSDKTSLDAKDTISWLSSTIDRASTVDAQVQDARTTLASYFPVGATTLPSSGVPTYTESNQAFHNLQSLTGLTTALDFRAYKRYLAFLAKKNFQFKSKMRQPIFTLTYQAALFENQVSIGIEVPVMVRFQEMEMNADLPIVEKQILAQNIVSPAINEKIQDQFFASYPGGLRDFYEKMLLSKGMISDHKSVRFGIGDMTFFMNRRVESPYWNQGVVGLGLTLPTATPPDRRFIWPAELGNGGFWEARLHSAMYWQYSRILNLHSFGGLRFRFSNSIPCRVAKFVSFDKSSGLASTAAKELPLGESTIFVNKSFTREPESKISAFAADPIQFVEYRKGAEILLRVGNVFDQVIFNCGYLDLFYEFAFKFADSLAYRYNDGMYDISKVVDDSESWRHLVGFTYVYRWSDYIHLEAKAGYTFAGKRCLRDCHLSLGSQFRF